MERPLQERIIGAIVLVVLAVLIVPVFLDGPSTDTENVQESITLPGQGGNSAKQKTIVLERDRTDPVPAARNGDTPTPKPQETASRTAEKKPEPAAERQIEATPVTDSGGVTSEQASSTGMWAVQLGSFSNQANAERLAADLRKAGFAAFLSQLNTGSGNLHRVRIGPQKDRATAESVAAKLKDEGQKGQVVPHP